MSLNNDLIAKIISYADVPVDTYLAFRNIGVKPKKLRALDPEFINKMDIIFNRTVIQWKYHIKLYANICVRQDDTISLCIIEKSLSHRIRFCNQNKTMVAYFIVKLYNYNIHIYSTLRYTEYDQLNGIQLITSVDA